MHEALWPTLFEFIRHWRYFPYSLRTFIYVAWTIYIVCRDIGFISISTQWFEKFDIWIMHCSDFEIWTAAIAWPGGHSHGCPYYENAARSSCSSLSAWKDLYGPLVSGIVYGAVLRIKKNHTSDTVYCFIVQVNFCWIHFESFCRFRRSIQAMFRKGDEERPPTRNRNNRNAGRWRSGLGQVPGHMDDVASETSSWSPCIRQGQGGEEADRAIMQDIAR